jgi:FkbM family methyltransferase
MINYKYENNSLRVEVTNEIVSVLNPSDFPLVLNIVDNSNKVHYVNKNLHVGHFSICYDVSYKTVSVFSNNGLKISSWNWSTDIHGDLSHKLFDTWAKKNLGSSGVVIGAHNGTSGEWVGPVMNGELKAVLIEPSEQSYQTLAKTFENRAFVNIEKTLITPVAGEFTFYECDEFQRGQLNSVFIENLTNVVDISQIKEIKINSHTLPDILDKYDIGKNDWWLQIDAEGLDYDILMKSDLSKYNLPSCLIFEKRDNNDEIDQWLSENGYVKYRSNLNMICFRYRK